MSNPSSPANSRPGAAPVGNRPTRRKWLLPLLLGLLALIALLFLLSQCGGDDESASNTAATSSPTAATSTPAGASSAPASAAASGPAGGGPAGEPGTVTAGGTNLLDAATAASLGEQDGEQAVGRAVQVQSVPADEGFWVGADEQDRMWVQLTDTGGESSYKVKQGDTIDFTGTVTRAAQGFAADAGVTAAEGADQLTELGHYISAPASSIKLSS